MRVISSTMFPQKCEHVAYVLSLLYAYCIVVDCWWREEGGALLKILFEKTASHPFRSQFSYEK